MQQTDMATIVAIPLPFPTVVELIAEARRVVTIARARLAEIDAAWEEAQR